MEDQLKELQTELKTLVERTEAMDHGEELKQANGRIGALEGKIEKLEATRKGASTSDDETVERKAAFRDFVRKGDVERKYLVEGTGNVGGFLVPDDFRSEVYNKIVEFSPVRQVATVLQTSSDKILVPTETAQFSASWTTEGGSRTSSTGQTFGQVEVDIHEMYVRIPVSNALLEDAAVDVEAWLMGRAAAQFAKLEGAAFVAGNGTGKPEGFTTNATVDGATVDTAATGTLTADDLISLYYDLPSEYAANAVWMVNRAVLAEIRQLEDTAGNYLWTPGFGGQPDTLLGRPVYESADMAGTVANTNIVAALGDFRAGYVIGDRVQMEMSRDPYSGADDGTTIFRIRRRVGGEVLLPEAIRTLTIAGA